jgi:RsiW-degrading membrane proteinase PrsW (M82 family)
MVLGIGLNIVFTVTEIVFSKKPDDAAYATGIGALLAFPPLLVYLFVPAIIDRFDPEPWWCLAMAFLWGALVATGFAGMINTGVLMVVSDAIGKQAGDVVTAVVCAPLTEEFWKGLCVLGFFYFLRREFDGVVDGIIYATFCALGFAAVENVSYYARAAAQGDQVLAGTFVLRGVLAPWGHPLYTSMTGIGFGIARESTNSAVRWLAPIGFYFIGVSMHATWNLIPTVFGGQVFAASLVLWMLFVLGFFLMIIVLVMRKGRVIRDNLKDEVLLGNLTQEDVNLICSPVGRLRCTFSWRGAPGRSFIRSAARLALSKWHTARAMKGQKRTISADFIAPLREQTKECKQQMMARAPRFAGPPGHPPYR